MYVGVYVCVYIYIYMKRERERERERYIEIEIEIEIEAAQCGSFLAALVRTMQPHGAFLGEAEGLQIPLTTKTIGFVQFPKS